MIAFLIGGTFFLRFWKQTRDGFFLIFAVAFWLMAVERIPLAFVYPNQETKPFVYLIRLAAFSLIIAAILYKNRKPPA